MFTIFIIKTEVAGTMAMTLQCRVRVLLRNFISHLVVFRIVTRIQWRIRWSGAWIPHTMSGLMMGECQTKLFWDLQRPSLCTLHIPFCDKPCCFKFVFSIQILGHGTTMSLLRCNVCMYIYIMNPCGCNDQLCNAMYL